MGSFNYNCDGQVSMFDITMPMISIENKIRLIELFAGYGSQAMALDIIGADYEHYKVVEFDKYAVQSYNAVHNANFEPTDIRNVHGKDLEISDTDKFTYMLTYSFPCTDLSVAGKMQGMKKGSGTRSGLLWEVERILQELKDGQGELPQVLFMENVPQVISSANIKDFHAWQDFLTSLGYTSHVQTLNAKDYGVAQNRERTFMFSFLGEFNYKFPEPIPLKKTMKDYLEDEVDEKYYINSEKAQKLIKTLIADCRIAQKSDVGLSVIGSLNPEKECQDRVRVFSSDGISPGLRATDYKDPTKICVDLSIKNPSENNVANCITSRENRGISNQQSVGNGVLQIGNIMPTKTRDNPNQGRVYDSDYIAPCLHCMGGGNLEPIIIELGRLNSSQDGIVVDSSGISKTLTAGNNNQPKMVGVKCLNTKDENGKQPSYQERVYSTDGIATAICTYKPDNMILEKKAIVAMRGRNPDNPSDRNTGAPTEQRLEPNSQGLCNTITSVQKDNLVLENIIIDDTYGYGDTRLYENISPALRSERSGLKTIHIKQATKDGYIDCKIGEVADLSFPTSKTRRGRVQDNGDTCPTITAGETEICRIESLYRIRKLTPRECGRLMFVSDKNITKILSVVSNSQAYKQFGNSIVVLCMVAMFSNLNIQNKPRWNEIKDRY